MTHHLCQKLFLLALLFIVANLSGCFFEEESQPAPVINAWHQSKANHSFYRVQPGDTIYSIAWMFGLDYRALAEANHLQAPYTISPDQRLAMVNTPPREQPTASAQKKSRFYGSLFPFVTVKENVAPKTTTVTPMMNWVWPTRGRLIERFSPNMANSQGIAIAGKTGQSIHAAAGGEVVYSGDGIRGYGNLIIIKHNSHYLSAYAFNQQNLVSVGNIVQTGNVIARMGKNDAGQTLLYFEIRKNGAPVNPLRYVQ